MKPTLKAPTAAREHTSSHGKGAAAAAKRATPNRPAAPTAVALVLARRFVTFDGRVLNVLTYAVLACAVAASIRYIYRHRVR